YTANDDGYFGSFYDPANGTFSDGIAIRAGLAADAITVTGSRHNAATVEVTGVYAGGGDDSVTVSDPHASYLAIHGPPGNDTIGAAAHEYELPDGQVITIGQPSALGGLVAFGDDGDDTLTGGDGEDVLVGGLGVDTIRGGAADDVVVGDLARILRDGGYLVQRISTEDDEHGGDDKLYSSQGNDVVIGGAGSDT